ncbi:MAG: hypothetical protein ACJ0H0_05610 [Vicinamibacterales bacterium]
MAHIIRLRGEQMHLYPPSQLGWRHYDGSSCGAGNTSGVESGSSCCDGKGITLAFSSTIRTV